MTSSLPMRARHVMHRANAFSPFPLSVNSISSSSFYYSLQILGAALLSKGREGKFIKPPKEAFNHNDNYYW